MSARGCAPGTTTKGIPYVAFLPKSACRFREEAPMKARYASEWASTGAEDTSRFQSLSGGNIGQPASVGPAGAGAGVPPSAAGGEAAAPPAGGTSTDGRSVPLAPPAAAAARIAK